MLKISARRSVKRKPIYDWIAGSDMELNRPISHMAPIKSFQLPLRRGRTSRTEAFSAKEPVTSLLTPTR
ncbi:hypothetical protein D3C75_1235040 [compost metagenome]